MADVLDVANELTAVLDKLCAADPAQLSDGEMLQLLHRQLDRLTAAATIATAAFDAGRAWEADGARSAPAWVAVRCHQPLATARRRVRLGRALRHMPAVEAAWLAGDIGEAHIVAFDSARTPATAASFERDEGLLVDQVRTMRYSKFVRALAYWGQLADPDGADEAAEAAHRARRLHLSQTFGGSWALDGSLDPIGGAIVAGAIKRIEDELFAVDWARPRPGWARV